MENILSGKKGTKKIQFIYQLYMEMEDEIETE